MHVYVICLCVCVICICAYVPFLPAVWQTWVESLVRKIPWGGNGYPLQYSFLENSMDRGGWSAPQLTQGLNWIIVHGVAKC